MGIAALMVMALLPVSAARAQLTAQVRSIDPRLAISASNVPLQLKGDAASVPTGWGYHLLPAHTEAGKHVALTGPVDQSTSEATSALKVKPFAALPKPGFFPADLTYFGGLIVKSASSEDIYYNCPSNTESCWGIPEQFLFDLGGSKFIHVTDQYTGFKTNNRYPLFGTYVYFPNQPTFLSATDVQDKVHQAAQLTDPGHIFHLFLAQGVDTCMDVNNTSCYSPDNLSTFTFCAYHGAVTYGDTGTLLYTVQPFQDVGGCVIAPPPGGYPNGELADSTNSTLSHEEFETITDPFGGLGNLAWVADSSAREVGEEIADECQGAFGNEGEIVPTYVLTNGHSRHTYEGQLEYSNARHGCVAAP